MDFFRSFTRLVAISLGSLLFVLPANGTDQSAFPSYALFNTQVRTLHSKIVGADYQLLISLPRDYDVSSSSYPVVMMLDADYSFAILHNVAWHFVDRKDIQPMILIGIAYPGAIKDRHFYKLTRTRDYTPTHVQKGGYGPEYQRLSGGADRFLDFVAQELFPYIEQNFRSKPDDRTLVGHSYGGLLATYALLTRPGLFQRFIIVSPSYWYDQRLIFRLEEKAAVSLKNLKAHVFFSIGGKEEPGMIKDLVAFAQKMSSRKYLGFQSEYWVVPEETHDGVFPAAATRGLRAVFAQKP